MNVLSIRTVPDPVLRSNTSVVAAERFGSRGLKRLLESMLHTMDTVNGVGLAGPQVGVSQAIFVFDLDQRRGHVINPTIKTWGDATHEPSEGCLSVPELYYTPPRAQFAKVSGVDLDGNPVTYEGEGLFARMLQHEVDHLGGYLFVDRLEGEQLRQARRAMASPTFQQATQRVNTQRSADISSAFGTGTSFGQFTRGGRS